MVNWIVNTEKTKEFLKKFVYNPYAIAGLFFSLFLVRIIYLNADPSFLMGIGDVGDEGYWAYNARNAILFHHWIIDDFNQSIAAAPLFSVLVFLSFKLFGLGLFQDRLVSAVASFLTLIVLYFFTKDTWNKKAALCSVLILGFNAVFVMHNKLGQVESTMMFFLLLTFYLWYKGNNKAIFYFISGIFFSLAVLTKITASYFIFGMLVLWALECVRKNSKLKDILLFLVGAAVPALVYIIFVLFPYWTKLYPFLVSVSGKVALVSLPYEIVKLQFNGFFGLIPDFILAIPLILYMAVLLCKMTHKSGSDLEIRKYIVKMNYMEIVALSWIFGGLSILLFTDFASRRFLVFLIPMTIIFTKILVDNYEFDLDKIIWGLVEIINKERLWIKIVVSFIIVFSIYSFLMVFLKLTLLSYSDESILSISLLYSLATLIFLLLPYFNTNRKVNYAKALTVLISFCGLIFLILLKLLQTLYFYIAANIGILTLNLDNSMAVASFLIIFPFFFISFIRSKNLLNITSKFTRNLFIIYLLINVALVGIQLTTSTFTIVESSQDLQGCIGNGDVVIGFWSHELSFENEMLPLWYLPNDSNFNTINQNISEYHPKFILISEIFDSRKNDLSQAYPTLSEFKKVKFIKKINLCPYPYTHNYKIVVDLYEIND